VRGAIITVLNKSFYDYALLKKQIISSKIFSVNDSTKVEIFAGKKREK
jgi:hypothetical protein